MTDPQISAYRPRPRWAQAIAGAFIAVIGGGLAWFAWHQVTSEGQFSLSAAFLGPAFLVIGLGLAAFGGYREERLARGESVDGLDGFHLLTTRWRILLAVALASGALYTLALRQGWVPR
jgi:TRAP-type C4-dicarboxylate transport system permease small subunit